MRAGRRLDLKTFGKGQIHGKTWRRGRDLNSRTPYEVSGFQDRHVRPLRHPSKPSSLDPEALYGCCRREIQGYELVFRDSFKPAHILP